MDKQIKVEGSPGARLTQLIGKFGHNEEMSIELATVIKPLPALTLRVESDGVTLEREDLIVAEHLTEHKRIINGAQATIGAALKAGDRVILIGDNDTQLYYVIDKAVM